MPYNQVQLGMMAHAVVYLYRRNDPRATRLIHSLAHRQNYRSQVVLEWITSQAAQFSRRHNLELYDSSDIEEFISRAHKGTMNPSRGNINDLLDEFMRKSDPGFFKGNWKP